MTSRPRIRGDRLPSTLDAHPPERAFEGGAFGFGRWRAPIAEPSFPHTRLGRLRLKEWHWVSLTTDRWFVSLALVQLGYAAQVFAYVVDRRAPRGAPAASYETLSPLGRAVSMAPSSVRGTSTFRRGRASVDIAWRDGWDVTVDLPVGGRPLSGHLHLDAGEALALLHPLGGGARAAYTHKAAALPASGRLRFGGATIDAAGGLGCTDWTRSLADRRTRWRWASMAGRLQGGRTIGLNLSSLVYDDARGASRENAVWIGGRVRPLGGVAFEVPSEPARTPWRIRSTGGANEVDLEVVPAGARADRVELGLVRSDFVQPFGTFRGRVAGEAVEDAFGVVEDHLALW